ncbi:ribonuclease H family protein [Pseudodesulfovibrio senegalensis]|uniref:ribonuclease H n=1 Tax=Pseudodesulfovibrio senegalensis TaxID=1721087 RepID=A0A6N6N0I9_9BACT|nr:ribonuclease H [Pseudodesulfovibrio senegalensis]KAB1441369.1 ribonuclease HI [Pseudodesulfovibrio senegalensis]
MSIVYIFANGACKRNQSVNNRGGYGVVIIENGQTFKFSQGYKNTNDKRMELRAVIAGLSNLKHPSTITIYVSNYVYDCITKGWLNKWRANKWRNTSGKKVKNIPLWVEMIPLAAQHNIEWLCANNHLELSQNEQANDLASLAAKSDNLLEDSGPTIIDN